MSGDLAYGAMARVFAAASTGSQKLSGEIGRPLCLVDAAIEPFSAVEDLNRRLHGCGRRWPGSFQSLRLEMGWDDWSLFEMEDRSRGARLPFGMCFCDGQIVAPLPLGLTLCEFRQQLAGAMRHMRLQEVTISAAYLEERCNSFAEMVVHPRYTPPRAATGDFRDAVVCNDLYAVDPAEHPLRIVWCAVEALATASEGRAPLWR